MAEKEYEQLELNDARLEGDVPVEVESQNGDPLTEAPYEGVGFQLSAARQRAGLSEEVVAERLRIRLPQLRALEAGRFEELPGRIYALGFLRSYADLLGLDGERTIEEFKQEDAGGGAPRLIFPEPTSEGRVPRFSLLLAALLVAGGVYGGWYYYQQNDKLLVEKVPAVPERLHEAAGEPPKIAVGDAALSGSTVSGSTVSDSTVSDAAVSDAEVGDRQVAAAPEAAAPASPAPEAGASVATASAPPASEPEKAVEGEESPAPAQVAKAAADDSAPAPQVDESARASQKAPAPKNIAKVEAPQKALAPKKIAEVEASRRVATTESTAPAMTAQAPAVQASGDAVPAEKARPEKAPAASQPQPRNEPEEPGIQADAAAASAPAEEAAPAPPAPAPPALAAAEQAEVGTVDPAGGQVFGIANNDARVVIHARQNSWVQVQGGDELLLTRVLKAGDSYFAPNRPDLLLMTGNAGGVEIRVDGKALPPVGPIGAVRRDLSLNADELLKQLVN